MQAISQETIDLIHNTADIVDVISEYVPLQPAGKHFKGLCPFHGEKTPSFFVSKERNYFKCYGCGEKGSAISFIQRYKNISFVEAIKELATKYHIPIDFDIKTNQDTSLDRYYEINELASQFYQVNLLNLERGKTAFEYLKNRGLDVHTIQYFELGYAPADFEKLFQELKQKYEPLELLEIGLIKKNQDRYYDLFRDRVIFPIRNEFGKVIGFSGRTYTGGEPNEAKYVNSPFTKIFTKGNVLYNLDKAIPFIKREKRVVLFEGFMDVIAAVSAGVKESICTMGTQLTEAHAKLIKKHTNRVLLCFDGDKAGFEATFKTIPILENHGLEVEVILLPEKLDPDEYVKKYSSSKFVEFLQKNAIDKHAFAYEYLKSAVDFTKPGDIEHFKLSVFEYFIKLQSGMLLEMMTKRLASDIQVSYDIIENDLHHYQLTKAIIETSQKRHTSKIELALPNKDYRAEQYLINYYIENEKYRHIIDTELGTGFIQDRFILEMYINIKAMIDENVLIRPNLALRFSKAKQEEAKKLVLQDYDYDEKDLADLISTIKIRDIKNEINEIENEILIAKDMKDKRRHLELKQLVVEKMGMIKKIESERTLYGKKRNSKSTY